MRRTCFWVACALVASGVVAACGGGDTTDLFAGVDAGDNGGEGGSADDATSGDDGSSGSNDGGLGGDGSDAAGGDGSANDSGDGGGPSDAGNDGMSDAGDAGANDSGGVDAGSDAGPDGGGTVDAGSDAGDAGSDSGAACAPLAKNPTAVFVDHAVAVTGTGTVACPFKTILEATSLPDPTGGVKRIVHVAGGTALNPVTYDESNLISVPLDVTLTGSGPRDATRIVVKADGLCIATERCSVFVNGGTLQNVTVANALDDGIGVSGAAGTANLQGVRVTGSVGDGISVSRSAVFVGVDASGNKGRGLSATGVSSATKPDLLDISETNQILTAFDNNGSYGMFLGVGAILNMNGGSASNNGSSGIDFSGGTTIGTTMHFHVLTSVNANGNGNGIVVTPASGVEIHPEASAKIRSSTFLKNSFNGITFLTPSSPNRNHLDLGVTNDPGCNTFASNGNTNTFAAVCVDYLGAGIDNDVPAEGNAWNASSCPLAETKLLLPTAGTSIACYSKQTSYSDVTFTESVIPTPDTSSPVTQPAACSKSQSCP